MFIFFFALCYIEGVGNGRLMVGAVWSELLGAGNCDESRVYEALETLLEAPFLIAIAFKIRL